MLGGLEPISAEMIPLSAWPHFRSVNFVYGVSFVFLNILVAFVMLHRRTFQFILVTSRVTFLSIFPKVQFLLSITLSL